MRSLSQGRVTLHDARRKAERTVELESFEIGVFAVTEEQLAEILPVPSRHPRRPAVDVSWFRAVHFCNAASEWEGLDPVYHFDGEDVEWDVTAGGYRLPTEAEWEYACRGIGRTALRVTLGCRVDECRRHPRTTRRRRQAPEPLRVVRHAREHVGVVLGPARS